MPGAGSLVAGRRSGYGELVFALLGMGLTIVFGIRFIVWYLKNWASFFGPQSDPLASFPGLWQHVRWALLGIGVFLVGWLWSLSTGLSILREAKSNASTPPRLS